MHHGSYEARFKVLCALIVFVLPSIFYSVQCLSSLFAAILLELKQVLNESTDKYFEVTVRKGHASVIPKFSPRLGLIFGEGTTTQVLYEELCVYDLLAGVVFAKFRITVFS